MGNLDRGWELKFAVANLTDEALANNADDVALSAATFAQFVEPPRLAFGRFSWSF